MNRCLCIRCLPSLSFLAIVRPFRTLWNPYVTLVAEDPNAKAQGIRCALQPRPGVERSFLGATGRRNRFEVLESR